MDNKPHLIHDVGSISAIPDRIIAETDYRALNDRVGQALSEGFAVLVFDGSGFAVKYRDPAEMLRTFVSLDSNVRRILTPGEDPRPRASRAYNRLLDKPGFASGNMVMVGIDEDMVLCEVGSPLGAKLN